ncbi:MAG TPA: hypothetical protein VFF07_14875 [Actinomycetota bacterium]|nr:hypothetical protein [Actinomycetota bacterium]
MILRPRTGGPGKLAWALWALAMLGIAATVWLHHLLRRAGRPDLMTPDILLFGALMTAATVGLVLARRRPGHPVGWLLLAVAVFLGADGVISGYAPYGLVVRPGVLPAPGWVAAYYPTFALAALACIGLVSLLTPTGSPPSPRWRWWVWVAAAAPIVNLVMVTLAPKPSASDFQALASPFDFTAYGGIVLGAHRVVLAVTVLAMGVGAGSLVVRFRRARGTERLQLRWLAFAAAPIGPVALVGVAADTMGYTSQIGDVAVELCVALLPVAIGAAILRYRLYDLDHIISRGLAYGALTLLLATGYVAVVLLLGGLLGRESSVSVAVATLAMAGLFQPARRRIQEAVDRRFNRRRYNATQTIEAFSARVRQDVDLESLTADLLAVVDQTMQPAQESLWLRPP